LVSRQLAGKEGTATAGRGNVAGEALIGEGEGGLWEPAGVLRKLTGDEGDRAHSWRKLRPECKLKLLERFACVSGKEPFLYGPGG